MRKIFGFSVLLCFGVRMDSVFKRGNEMELGAGMSEASLYLNRSPYTASFLVK